MPCDLSSHGIIICKYRPAALGVRRSDNNHVYTAAARREKESNDEYSDYGNNSNNRGRGVLLTWVLRESPGRVVKGVENIFRQTGLRHG